MPGNFPGRGDGGIGRGSGNEIRLIHPSVSREHLVLEPGAGGVRVRDLGSLAGSVLNDKPLSEPAALQHGDVLEVGVFRLVFEQDRSSPVPPIRPRPTRIQAALPAAQAVIPAPEPGGDRTAAVLYRLSETLLSLGDPDLLMDKFLAEVLAALPGDSVALVRIDPLSGKLEVRRRRDRAHRLRRRTARSAGRW